MGESDFRTVLTTIKAANPDAVYLAAAPNEGAQIIPQARRDVGLNTIFLNVENNDAPEFYKGIGQYGEYAIIESRFSPYVTPPGELADEQTTFKNNYYTKWGTYPDMMGASTYDVPILLQMRLKLPGPSTRLIFRRHLPTPVIRRFANT